LSPDVPPPRPATPLLRALSRTTGWLADRRVPRFLRAPLYRAFSRLYGLDLSEVRLALDGHASFSAFFVRQLVDGARPGPDAPDALASPVDGTVQAVDRVREGSLLQAKGRPYPVRELLAGVGEDLELEGGTAWTVYLSPRDYHRVHAPATAALTEVAWVPGALHSVAPRVLASRARVLSINERAVLRLETAAGPLLLVLVGALNVGRLRVVGVEPGHRGPLASTRRLERLDELGRFELGSTIVLVAPPGVATAAPELEPGRPLRMGEAIGRLAGASGAWCPGSGH
jgi:phosphatidylserine decarboxylase